MNNAISIRLIRAIVARYPAVVKHLTGGARWIAFTFDVDPIYDEKDGGFFFPKSISYNKWLRLRDFKTYDFFLTTMERLIRSVYNNQLSGEFLDIVANLISGQLRQAYNQAWEQSGLPGAFPSYLQEDLMNLVVGQFVHVDQLYKDIVDARIDETPIGALLVRAPLWANRWNEAHNRAAHLIRVANGGLEMWMLGQTEEHCDSCSKLNHIVAYAQEWQMLDVHPQQAPNKKLECQGWRCDCMLVPTDKPRTDRAFEKIRKITGG
jgi:hypothetical protein